MRNPPILLITNGTDEVSLIRVTADAVLGGLPDGFGSVGIVPHSGDRTNISDESQQFTEKYVVAIKQYSTDGLARETRKLFELLRKAWLYNNKPDRYETPVYMIARSVGETNSRNSLIWGSPQITGPYPIFNTALEQAMVLDNVGIDIRRYAWKDYSQGALPDPMTLMETDGPADPTAAWTSNHYDDHNLNTILVEEDGVGTTIEMELVDGERGWMAGWAAHAPTWDKEVGDLAGFDAVVDADNDLNDSPDAAHDGANGLEVTFDDANVAYGTLNFTAINQTSMVATLWLNLNDLEIEANSYIELMQVVDGAAQVNAIFRLYRSVTSAYRLLYYIRNDSAAYDQIASYDIDHEKWYRIDLFGKMATGVGANDGTGHFYLDGILVGSESCLDNDTLDYDIAQVGMVATTSGAFGGSFYFDTIKIDPVGAMIADKLARHTGQFGYDTLINDNTPRYGRLDGPTDDTDVIAEFWHKQWGALGLETDELTGLLLEDGAAVGGETIDGKVLVKNDAVRILAYEDDGFWRRPAADEFGEEMELYMPFDYDSIDRARGQVPATEAGGVIYPRWMTAAFGSGLVQVGLATTNMCDNPSFETNNALWTSGGTNTNAQSDEQAKFGDYSLKCTYQDSTDFGHHTKILTAVDHAGGLWIYVPTDYDGTNINLKFKWYVGGATVDGPVDMSVRDEWQYVTATCTPVGGDLNGELRVEIAGVPTVGKFIYIDGVQIEAKAFPTPTCIGDMGAGHAFTGAAHASTSTRVASELMHDIVIPPELIANGGFEDPGGGGADIWDDWDEIAGDGALANEVVIVHLGNDAAKVTAGVTRNTRVNQTFTVVPNATYRLRLWTRGDGSSPTRYRVFDETNGVSIIPTSLTDISGVVYTLFSTTFTAPADCVSARIELWCINVNGAVAYFDDVSVRTATNASEKGTLSFVITPIYETDEMDISAYVITINDNGPDNRIIFYVGAGSTNWRTTYIGNGTSITQSATGSAIPRLENTRVTITWDLEADELKTFINGLQDGTTSGGLTVPSGPWKFIDIGANRAGTAQFSGWLDEMFLLTGTVLTPAEILARHEAAEVMGLDWVSIDQDEWHDVKTRLQFGSAPGADDGVMQLWVDDVLEQEITGLDNDQKNVDSIYWGAPEIADPYSVGMVRMDFCRWWAPGFDIFPDPASVNDAIYFGGDEPFYHIMAVLATAGVYAGVTLEYQYYNGAWIQLAEGDEYTLYQTDDHFRDLGHWAFNWKGKDDWQTVAVGGVTKFWIRVIITAVGSWTTSPAFGVDSVYNQKTPQIRIPAASLKGDAPPTTLIKFKQSYGGDDDVFFSNNSRIIVGAKSRHTDEFHSHLNCGGDGLPPGITVTYGDDTSSEASEIAPGGDRAICDFVGDSTMDMRIRFKLENLLDVYRGKYLPYLRVTQNGGDPGDCYVKLRIRIVGLEDYDTLWDGPAIQLEGTDAAGGDLEIVSLNPQQTISLPIHTTKLADVFPNATFYLEVWASRTTGASELEFYDLILIPADEWTCELDDPITADGSPSALRGSTGLDLDGGVIDNRTRKFIIDWDNDEFVPAEPWSRHGYPPRLDPYEGDTYLYFLLAHYPEGEDFGDRPLCGRLGMSLLTEIYPHYIYHYLRGDD